MNKFMKMEDNNDGTTTIEICFDGETTHSFIMTMSIDDFMVNVVSELTAASQGIAENLAEGFIPVPTTIEGASND